jgi:hypothetical protein
MFSHDASIGSLFYKHVKTDAITTIDLLPYLWYTTSSVVTLLSVRVKLQAFLLRDSVQVIIPFYGIKSNSAVTSLTQSIPLASRYSTSDVWGLTNFCLETDWTSCNIACIMKIHNPCVRASGWNSSFIFGRARVQILSCRLDISQEMFIGFVQTIQVIPWWHL